MKALLTMLMVAAPVPAMAAPVNLTCSFGTTRPLVVSLDEQAGTASYTWAEGRVAKYDATFTPDTVSFGHFSINRVTLAALRRNDATMVAQGKMPATTPGTCELVKVDRAF